MVAKAIIFFPWGCQQSNSFLIFKWTLGADPVQAKQINTVSYAKCIQTRILEGGEEIDAASKQMMERRGMRSTGLAKNGKMAATSTCALGVRKGWRIRWREL